MAGLLLMPFTLLILTIGKHVPSFVGNSSLEAAAIFALFVVNSSTWMLAYRWLMSRRDKMSVPQES